MEEASRPNLKALWEALKCLVKPTNESGQFKDLHGAFQVNVLKATAVLGFEDVRKIPYQGSPDDCGSGMMWDFVEIAVYILLCLKDQLKTEDLSVSQQKDVRNSLQFVVSLGIHPNIMPNLGYIVSDSSAVLELVKEESTTEMQKYERLCVVVKSLLNICNNLNFRSLIISNIISQLLVSLFQLSFAPIKKPSPDACQSSTQRENVIMTEDLWNRLQKDKQIFRASLDNLVKETYQPKIMFELMLLQGNQRNYSPPLWLRKASSNLLTSCLIQPGGVAALIQAAFDSAPDTGSDWKKIDTLSRIITSPIHHYGSISEQLLNLMDVARNGPHDMYLVTVACVKQFYEKDAPTCQKLIIEPLLLPLKNVFSDSSVVQKEGHVLLNEEETDSIVKQIHLCFTSSSSKVTSVNLPAKILVPYTNLFFKLFFKVSGSVSILLKYCEDILYHILCDSNQEELSNVLQCVLLGSETEGIYMFPRNFYFNFGSNGGVSLKISSEPEKDLFSSSVEDSGNRLMDLLEKRNDSSVSFAVFEVLLKMLVDMGMKPKTVNSYSNKLETWEDTLASLMLSSEKHLGIVRLLAVLVENANVKKRLSESPGPILIFINNLFYTAVHNESLNEIGENEDSECVFVAFMILNVILDNCGEDTDWSSFQNLLQPVNIIRNKTENEELRRLASRVYNIISACGAAQEIIPGRHEDESKKTKCEEALHDACDPLLPVRGHALVQLAKLLQQRDKETVAKKEAVLCLFKENLKNSDSYIYLGAINGIVAFASIKPDEAVKSLIQEYVEISSAGSSSDRNPELRMKVGEILVKLIRNLGAVAPKFKNELLNAFLCGTKDVDHLMRASSFSNLGEVCEILGFRIGPVLRELLLCIRNTLNFDKAVEPRRASVMVVTHLLRGLEADTLNTLQDAALELYRTLKDIYYNDKDDVVRLHAQLALEELGRLAKDFLFPKLPLQKKLQILPL